MPKTPPLDTATRRAAARMFIDALTDDDWA